MWFFLWSSSYLSLPFTIQLNTNSQIITYSHWDEHYFGKAIVASPGLNKNIREDQEECTESPCNCSSQSERNTPCHRESKKRGRTQVVGHSFRMITYCHKCSEQYVSSHHYALDSSSDWFYFISNLIHYELENDEMVNKIEVYN